MTAVATAVPPHVVAQKDAREQAARVFRRAGGFESRWLEVFDRAGIETRRSVMPFEWFLESHGFAERNRLYGEHALALGAEAAGRALGRAGLTPGQVDHIVFVSTTGLSTPSIDAHLANRLGFSQHVSRTPLWGLGCSGAVAGLGRAAAFARAEPRARILLVAVELCTLNFQSGDSSPRNVIGSALFADGAAAVVVEGAEARSADMSAAPERSLELLGSGSTMWRDSTDVMGWTFDEQGLHLVLSRDIPEIVRTCFRPALERFLTSLDVRFADVDHVVAHPGGVRVLDALEEALDMPQGALVEPRDILRMLGNMSSPTCFFVLERVLDGDGIAPGERAILAALGAGFSAEFVLARRPVANGSGAGAPAA